MNAFLRTARAIYRDLCETTSYAPFARLPLRLRLMAALGFELIFASLILLGYLVYRPHLYTSGPAGRAVLVALGALFLAFSLLAVPPLVSPSIGRFFGRHKKKVTAIAMLFGGGVGFLSGMASSQEMLPFMNTPLFKSDPDGISDLFALSILGLSAGGTFASTCMVHLHREGVQMESELQLAQGIQQRLLPDVSESGEDYAVYGTARLASEVGGDFFDAVCPNVPGAPLIVGIGDVAGHNVAAGLMMAMAKGAFRGALGQPQTAEAVPAVFSDDLLPPHEEPRLPDSEEDVRRILNTMNHTVYSHAGRRYFISCQVGVFDFARGHLVLGNAGHVPLLCRRRDSGQVEHFTPRSAALGVLPAAGVGVEVVPFAPGDTFLFYTDGLLEARAPDGEEFGLERARALLADAAASHEPEALCDHFFEALEAHTDGRAPADDVTLLAVQVAP